MRIHTIVSHFLQVSARKFLSGQVDQVSFFLSEDCEMEDWFPLL